MNTVLSCALQRYGKQYTWELTSALIGGLNQVCANNKICEVREALFEPLNGRETWLQLELVTSRLSVYVIHFAVPRPAGQSDKAWQSTVIAFVYLLLGIQPVTNKVREEERGEPKVTAGISSPVLSMDDSGQLWISFPRNYPLERAASFMTECARSSGRPVRSIFDGATVIAVALDDETTVLERIQMSLLVQRTLLFQEAPEPVPESICPYKPKRVIEA